MNAFKKTVLGLGGVAALAMGVAVMSTGAQAQSECASCVDWQNQLQASAQHTTTRGANLAFPGMANAPAAQTASNVPGNSCNDILNAPSRYPYDEVRVCTAMAH